MKTDPVAIWEYWNRFWFQPLLAPSAQMTRALIGCASLLVFANHAALASQWLGDSGWFNGSAALALAGQGVEGTGAEYRWSPLYSYPWLGFPLTVLGIIASLAMIVGRWSWLGCLIAYVVLVMIHHRIPLLINKGEPLLVASVLYCTLLTPIRETSLFRVFSNLALRMLQIHFLIWIAMSLFSMLANETWWTGEAVRQLIVDGQGFLPSKGTPLWCAEFLAHGVLVLQVGILAAALNPSIRPLGRWLTIAFCAVILLVIGDWIYAAILFATSTSIWPIPPGIAVSTHESRSR
jgi:hypothetical protein